MGQILVRGLEDDVVTRLKDRAASHGRSLESEARSILETAAGFSVEDARRVIGGWQRRLADRPFTDSVDLIREDRQR